MCNCKNPGEEPERRQVKVTRMDGEIKMVDEEPERRQNQWVDPNWDDEDSVVRQGKMSTEPKVTKEGNHYYGNAKTMDDGMMDILEDGVFDTVNHPYHYTRGSMETIDIIEKIVEPNNYPFEAYLISNVVKYLCRYDIKGKPVHDLEKAQWYLEKLKNVVFMRTNMKEIC